MLGKHEMNKERLGFQVRGIFENSIALTCSFIQDENLGSLNDRASDS